MLEVASKPAKILILRKHILLLEKELSLAERINSCRVAIHIMAKNIEWLYWKLTGLEEEKTQLRQERKAFEHCYAAILHNGPKKKTG